MINAIEACDLFLTDFDTKKLEQSKNKMIIELNYARFLISVNDFNKIIKIYNEILKLLGAHCSKFYKIIGPDKFVTDEQKKLLEEKVSEMPKLTNEISKLKKEFLAIIASYLQVEQQSWLQKLTKKLKRKKNVF